MILNQSIDKAISSLTAKFSYVLSLITLNCGILIHVSVFFSQCLYICEDFRACLYSFISMPSFRFSWRFISWRFRVQVCQQQSHEVNNILIHSMRKYWYPEGYSWVFQSLGLKSGWLAPLVAELWYSWQILVSCQDLLTELVRFIRWFGQPLHLNQLVRPHEHHINLSVDCFLIHAMTLKYFTCQGFQKHLLWRLLVWPGH